LGPTGLKVSEISFGTWVNFDDPSKFETNEACMLAAYEHGVNFFDGAEAYGVNIGDAERTIGKIIHKAGWKRDSYIVSSKIVPGGHGPETPPTAKGLNRKHIVDGCDDALKRMGVDYIDLYFCHRPDPETPLEETVFAMNDLIHQGKILYWATSCFFPETLARIYAIASRERLHPPVAEQVPFNMILPKLVEQDLLPLINGHGLGITAFSPLASGLLTGKYLDESPEQGRFRSEKGRASLERRHGHLFPALRTVRRIAEELGLPMSRFCLAWALKNKSISTLITSATRPEQIIENARASDDVEALTDEVMKTVKEAFDEVQGPR
jgi:aryl-alcohol dehydrogenase-like predicted oxidoreductase